MASSPKARWRKGMRPGRSLGGFGCHLVEALGQRVPAQCRTLDADRELHHTLECGELAELVEVDLLRLARYDLGVGAIVVRPEVGLVDRHHPLEGGDQAAHLTNGLAFDGG